MLSRGLPDEITSTSRALKDVLSAGPRNVAPTERERLPERPAAGRLGLALDCVSNHVKVDGFERKAYHYSIKINPKDEAKGKLLREAEAIHTDEAQPELGLGGASGKRVGSKKRAMATAALTGDVTDVLPIEKVQEIVELACANAQLNANDYAHDGRKIILSRHRLFPENKTNVLVKTEDGHQFMVTIELVDHKGRDLSALVSKEALVTHARSMLDIGSQNVGATPFTEQLQVLEIALRAELRRRDWCILGRQVFPARPDSMPLEGGMELWAGVSQALRPCQRGLLWCVFCPFSLCDLVFWIP